MKIVISVLFLFLFVFLPNRGQSQESVNSCCKEDKMKSISEPPTVVNTSKVVIDLQTKDISFDKSIADLKRGKAVRIKVNNYNPFLYNVVINSTDSNVYAMVDNGNMLNWFLNPSNLSSIAANLLTAPIAPPSLIHESAKLMRQSNTEIYLDSASTFRSLINTTTTIDLTVIHFFNRQRSSIKSYQESIDNLKKTIEDSLYEWSKIFRLKSRLDISKIQFPDSTSVNRIERQYKKYRDSVGHWIKRIETSHQQYIDSSTEDTYANAIKNTIDSVPDAYIKKFYVKAADYLNKVDSVISIKNLQTLTEALENMQDYKSCFTSLPIFLTRDIKPITIQMKPWKDSAGLQSYSTSFEIPWQQKQIWGVSAGIYGGGLYNYIYTPKQGISPDTTYTIVEDNGSKSEFGINALAYTAWNWPKNTSAYTGIAFGAGVPFTSTLKPRVLLGWTNIWGNNNRVILTVGVIGGPVERLSKVYSNTDAYSNKPTQYMKDVIKVNGFISINYSFLGR